MSSVRIGTAGWTIPGQFASHAPAPGTHLERYARVQNCVEINSSFYRPHRAATWQRWADSVPDDFRFSVKAPKMITHEAALACSADQLKEFLQSVDLLGEKLGPILFQLPPKGVFRLETAERFFNVYRSMHRGPTVFEPRHPTWFTRQATELFTRFEIACAAVDPPPVPEAAMPAGWPGVVYHRLHGSPRIYYSEYSQPYIQSLAAAVLRECETAEVWCIFDNTALGHAFGNALTLGHLLAPIER